MCYWPEECPMCGYVAYDIEVPSQTEEGWLSSDEYISCDRHVFRSTLAGKFFKIYLLAKRQHNSQDAFNALLNAAWACDDAKDLKGASFCRRRSLSWLEEEMQRDCQIAETFTIMKADILRRAGLFDQVVKEYSDRTFSEELLTSIAAFQVKKAREHDSSCYRLSDVK